VGGEQIRSDRTGLGPVTRPAPMVLPGGHGLVVPAELAAELAAALDSLIGMLARPVPVGCRQPRVTAVILAVRAAARRAATEHEAARHRAAAWGHPTPVVVVPAQTPASWSQEITTSDAAGLSGLSQERWRQIAASGAVPARRVAGRWLLDRRAVVSREARRNSDDGGHDEQPV